MTTESIHRKRRIPQWVVWPSGTVLLVVAVYALDFGLRLDRQQRTIADFRARGCNLIPEAEKPKLFFRWPNWFITWISPQNRNLQLALSSSIYFDANGQGLTDEDLQHLTGIANVSVLHLRGTRITDAGLVHLARLTKLSYLDLHGTPVTPSGIVTLKVSFPELVVIHNLEDATPAP